MHAPAPGYSVGTCELSVHTGAPWTKPACLATYVCFPLLRISFYFLNVQFENGHEL